MGSSSRFCSICTFAFIVGRTIYLFHRKIHFIKHGVRRVKDFLISFIMFSKIFIFSCFLASGLAYVLVSTNCKVETVDVTTASCSLALKKVCGAEADGKVIFQTVVAADPVCADVVDKLCVPVLKALGVDGCTEVTRKVCLASTKLVDVPSLPIPAVFQNEAFCSLIPKGECKDVVTKLSKTVCEPVEL